MCVANSLEFSHLPRAFDPAEPLHSKENLKKNKYGAGCAARGYQFLPFVCGSLGGFNEDALLILKEVARVEAAVVGVPRSIMIDRMRKKISFGVQKSQASAWMRRGTLANVLL